MKTGSRLWGVPSAAVLAILTLFVAEPRAQEFIDLDEFENRFDEVLGPVDRSIIGFLSLTERFSFNALLGLGTGGVESFRTFTDEARAVIDTVPIPSGSTSVTYLFDPALETFVRRELPLAPAISQNARTNGRNILTLGVSYSYLDFQKFDDFEHDNAIFEAGSALPLGGGFALRDILYFNFKLRQQVYAFAMQFGLLDNLDIGVFVPLIDLDFRGKAIDMFVLENPDGSVTAFMGSGRTVPSIKDLRQSDFFGLNFPGIQRSEHRTDVGDVILRTKYFFGSAGPVDFGALLGVSLPTGDEDDLFGVGAVRFDPRMLISSAGERVAVHVNAGYHADVEETDRDRVDYAGGGEVRVTRWLTLLVDQIGRIGVSGATQVRKFEVIPGVKLNPYGDVIVGFNAIVPLNREGLTTEWTPNATGEVTVRF